jgi:hypothetical protein
MLRHIVMMKFRNRETAKETAGKVKKMLDGLVPVIDELKRMEVGINVNTKPAAYDLVLTADFDDEAGLNAYRAHPDHVKILDFMKEVVDKTTVVDYYL